MRYEPDVIRLEVRCGRYWRCRFSPFNLRKAAAVCRQCRKVSAKEIHGLRREKLKQYQRFVCSSCPEGIRGEMNRQCA